MDLQNAFLGKVDPPTDAEVSTALGQAAEVWKQLVDWFAEQGVTDSEWKSYSTKAGWALLLKRKKRTIVYLAPCPGCVRVAFVLGDRAVAAARQSDLPKAVLKIIEEAPHYAEGTGIRVIIKNAEDLELIRRLALIKLAN
jgi:hypothetical protein